MVRRPNCKPIAQLNHCSPLHQGFRSYPKNWIRLWKLSSLSWLWFSSNRPKCHWSRAKPRRTRKWVPKITPRERKIESRSQRATLDKQLRIKRTRNQSNYRKIQASHRMLQTKTQSARLKNSHRVSQKWGKIKTWARPLDLLLKGKDHLERARLSRAPWKRLRSWRGNRRKRLSSSKRLRILWIFLSSVRRTSTQGLTMWWTFRMIKQWSPSRLRKLETTKELQSRICMSSWVFSQKTTNRTHIEKTLKKKGSTRRSSQ